MNNDITNLKYVEVPVVVLLDEDLSRTITSCIASLRKKNYIRVESEPNTRRIYLANIF